MDRCNFVNFLAWIKTVFSIMPPQWHGWFEFLTTGRFLIICCLGEGSLSYGICSQSQLYFWTKKYVQIGCVVLWCDMIWIFFCREMTSWSCPTQMWDGRPTSPCWGVWSPRWVGWCPTGQWWPGNSSSPVWWTFPTQHTCYNQVGRNLCG